MQTATSNPHTVQEYEAIEAAVYDGYIAGMLTGDPERAKRTFTETGSVFHGYSPEEGTYLDGRIENLYDAIAEKGAAPELKYRVEILDMAETIAVVKILLEGTAENGYFTDYFSMLKIDGEWKCVAKVYHKYDA
jgi:hypothetical protein